jgi:indolepyruvate ferredoxin oxidoreductase beta subunit
LKQQIIVSGLGGQGALTVTRLLAEAAAALGLEVITSETHGMAQRGGTVISMIKVGPFKGPLIPAGAAEVGLFLAGKNLEVHRGYLAPEARIYVNSAAPGDYFRVDARRLAEDMGAPVAANLILLGFAVAQGGFFCGVELMERLIAEKIPARFRDTNLAAFRLGVAAAGKVQS